MALDEMLAEPQVTVQFEEVGKRSCPAKGMKRGTKLRLNDPASQLAVKLVKEATKVQSVPSSDDAKFTRLLEESRSKMMGYAMNMARNKTKAEDLVQTAMLKAWAARSRFEIGSNFLAWIMTILYNEFIQTFRNGFNKNTVVESDQTALNEALSPSDSLTYLQHSEVIVAMSRLPPDHREIAFLILLDGWSYEAVAERLGTSVGTVKSRIWRARQALCRQFDVAMLQD